MCDYVCICVWVCAHEHRCPRRPEASDCSGAEVSRLSELPDVGARDLIQVCWKSSKHSLTPASLFFEIESLIEPGAC